MLSRPTRRRFALLALLAAMLLVVMPTFAQLRGAGAPHGAAGVHAMQDAMAGMDHGAMPAGHDHRQQLNGDCAYCPLLAGLLHWSATPLDVLHEGTKRFASTIDEQARRARTHAGSLGSRGPPALRAV